MGTEKKDHPPAKLVGGWENQSSRLYASITQAGISKRRAAAGRTERQPGSETGAVLSGFALILLLLSFVPLFKLVKKMLESPAAHTMWLICFILFFCLSKIADEMTVISFVGFVSNLIGAAIFKLADRRIGENEKQI